MCGDCRNHRARLPDWADCSPDLATRSPLSFLFSLSSLSLFCYPRRYLAARQCAPNALCCTLHRQLGRCQCITYLPARPYATAPLSTPFFFLFSCSSFFLFFSSLLFCRSSCPPFPPDATASSVHLDSSFCSRFSRSCCPFAPIHSPCTSFFSFLFFFFVSILLADILDSSVCIFVNASSLPPFFSLL